MASKGKQELTSTALEEYDLMKDPKYRLYVSAIDKALKSFENYTDWPDLIHSLTKLNKVIKDNQRYPVIPRRIKISKRLAQCMHKTWSAGVHLKALEVYDTIFKCMGTNRLSHELFIFSAGKTTLVRWFLLHGFPLSKQAKQIIEETKVTLYTLSNLNLDTHPLTCGLFPLLEHSTITVKSPLLIMYETHFVPLGPRLLPGLSGFLTGVLPGLEEGSDHFDRVNLLLEKVCEGVGATAFYGCIWQCVAGNAAVRLPAVMFVLSHVNKAVPIEDQQFIMGTSIEVMVKALCACVQDTNALVQRTTLDLLLVAFPLHNIHLVASDVIRLVQSALSAILRRDMSLNRRLYSWLLGSELNMSSLQRDHPLLRQLEETPEVPRSSIYFDLFSKEHLIQGVKGVLVDMSADIRPYRLLTSLMDRPDVGSVVLDDILFEVFRVLYFTSKADEPLGSPKRKTDIIKSANLFFNSLEPWYIWQYLGSIFDQALKMVVDGDVRGFTPGSDNIVKGVGDGVPDLWEVCELSEFLLRVIPIEAMASSCEHLMNLLLRLTALLTKFVDALSCDQLRRCLNVCRMLLNRLQPRQVSKPKVASDKEADEGAGDVVRPSKIRSWIGKEKPLNDTVTYSTESAAEKTSKVFNETLKTFLKEFQTFFVTFVGGGRIINNQCVPRAFEKLKKSGATQNEKYADELRKFLTTVITERDSVGELQLHQSDLAYRDLDLVVAGSKAWCDCFMIACGVLVDNAAFYRESESTMNAFTLPPWAKTLLVCCCYLDKSPRLQITAIQSFLDLIQPKDHSNDEESVESSPLFDALQVYYIQKSTNVVKIITEVLWSHLGALAPHMQVTCAELLHQLLNTVVSDGAVERILGEALLTGDEATRVESLLKFIKLWTIGRELQDGRQKRCFQSCLLKVLDNMLLPHNSPLRLQTEEWLCEALMRGDIARLLDPLLLILLDQSSARLGILHVSIKPSAPEAVPEEPPLDDTSKIYAISSVDGNVIYHVSDAPRRNQNGFPRRTKWRWKKDSPPDQRVFAVTSLKGSPDSQLRFITEKNVSRSIELPRSSANTVSLIVNPMNAGDDDDVLSDAGSVDYVIKNARRFNPDTGDVEETMAKKSDSSQNVQKLPNVRTDLFEEAVPADDFLENNEEDAVRISRDILNSVVDAVVRKLDKSSETTGGGVGVHPLHSHILLYCSVFDSTRTLYAFNALKNILHTNPRLFLCCSATSGTVNATYPSDLLMFLARHRKSVYGRSFDGPPGSLGEYTSAFRSSMYLEVLVSLCLNFARSYYPNLGHRLSPDVLAGNRMVQLSSIETLTDVLTELMPLVRDSGKGFANYIATILSKCKVQKNILHCTMSSLNTIRHQLQLYDPRCGARTFTEEIVEFNDASEGPSLTEHSRAMQVQLLKLMLALIKLEYDVDCYQHEAADGTTQASSTEHSGSTLTPSYSPGYLIPQQPLFFRAVASALSLKGSMRALHSDWTQLVTSSLPYLGVALPHIVMTVVNQLCVNIEELARIYADPFSEEDLPPDYALTQLEALTVLCHYCVLDSSQQVSPLGLGSASGTSSSSNVPNSTQIFNNLVHVFTPLPLIQIVFRRVAISVGNRRVLSFLQKYPSLSEMLLGTRDDSSKDRNQHMEALRSVRLAVLKRLPRIIASLAVFWASVALDSSRHEITVWGCPKIVRNQILEFLSPLSVHHGPYFLAAMAVTWHERRDTSSKHILPEPTADQQVLVNLLGSIKVLPIDTFVQTVHSILKQPPAVEASIQDMSLDVSVLELFYVYMQTTNCTQLAECWTSLLALLKDSLLLQPPALFLVLAILNEFVQRSPAFQEKKDQRDLQDITAKLIEGCAAVAGACLEQTTWLKRNLSIRDLDSIEDEAGLTHASALLQHSVEAQLVLGQLLAPLLDVSYGSQEKEKVATLLMSVMYNVTPYLKNHQVKYAASFSACSQLLANISGYPYTRKAWKKDAFDLLLDPSLFQMEANCLTHWNTIVDNLMTHDQTTFNDLMGCIPTAPSASYNLFSSRDQEYEQRAQMLKRLAFVVMCSDKDQYCKSILPIQDRLSESLRLPQVVPSIQAQVFLCFRVLLLRMSSDHVDALWSLIISEMVQVFMNIEEELARESDEFNSHIRVMSALDSSWVVNSSNGLNAHGHPHWLLLTLAAVKLLDLAVLLPAHLLPQFQMYRWAFVGDNLEGTRQEHEFIPHVERISKLMDRKYGPCNLFVRPKEGRLLTEMRSLEGLQQLHYFFTALPMRPKSNAVDVEALEKFILRDFLDEFPSSPVNS